MDISASPTLKVERKDIAIEAQKGGTTPTGQEYRERLKERLEKYRARGQTQTQRLRERVENWRRGEGSTLSGQGLVKEVREKGLVEGVREYRARRGSVSRLKYYGKESAVEAMKVQKGRVAVEAQLVRPEWVSQEKWVMLTPEQQQDLLTGAGVGFEAVRDYLKYMTPPEVKPENRRRIAIS